MLQVNNVRLGTYTITETMAPPGYAIDDDRHVASITCQRRRPERGDRRAGSDQPGDTDESDFHNRLCWAASPGRSGPPTPTRCCWPERRSRSAPTRPTGVGTLTSWSMAGVNDADGLANGVLQVNNVLLGTYTITETMAPPGYALDDVASRSHYRFQPGPERGDRRAGKQPSGRQQ